MRLYYGPLAAESLLKEKEQEQRKGTVESEPLRNRSVENRSERLRLVQVLLLVKRWKIVGYHSSIGYAKNPQNPAVVFLFSSVVSHYGGFPSVNHKSGIEG